MTPGRPDTACAPADESPTHPREPPRVLREPQVLPVVDRDLRSASRREPPDLPASIRACDHRTRAVPPPTAATRRVTPPPSNPGFRRRRDGRRPSTAPLSGPIGRPQRAPDAPDGPNRPGQARARLRARLRAVQPPVAMGARVFVEWVAAQESPALTPPASRGVVLTEGAGRGRVGRRSKGPVGRAGRRPGGRRSGSVEPDAIAATPPEECFADRAERPPAGSRGPLVIVVRPGDRASGSWMVRDR
jgi:hypothetical protein